MARKASVDEQAAQALLAILEAGLPSFPGLHDWRKTATIQRARAAAADGRCVLVVGRKRSIVLSPDAVELWLRDFYVHIPLSIAGDPPTEEEATRDIGWVLRFGAAGRELTSESELDADDGLHRIIAKEFIRATRA